MTTTAPEVHRRPVPRRMLARLGADTWYCLSGLPIAVASFVAVLTLFVAGVGLSVTFAGVFVLVAGMWTARAFAHLERRRLAALLGRQVTRPKYKSRQGRTGLSRVLLPLTEGQSWV